MNDKINRLMAVEVMGWYEGDYAYKRAWYKDASNVALYVKGFTPTTDMNQAMECWTTYTKSDTCESHYWELLKMMGRWMFRNHTDEGLSCDIEISVMEDTAPLAICKAILKAKGVACE